MEWWPTTACMPRAPVYTPDGPTIRPQAGDKENRLDQVVKRSELRAEPIHRMPLGAAFRVWLRALLLSMAAVTTFRFKAGMIPAIAACLPAGLALYLAGVIS
jgi:hypothetical protein